MYKKLLPLLIILLSLPIIFPYFHLGYFPTHDGEWAVVRLGEMFRELRDFQVPPRFSTTLNFGFGYPLFNFAYPLPYYLGFFLHLFKLPFITSIKFLFAMTVPVSGAGMFFLAKRFWKSNLGGLISSIFYMYLPYRIVDLYVRGSIGESLAFAIIPWILYFLILLKTSQERNGMYVSLISLLFACLVLNHNIMAVLLTPIILLFIILLSWKDNFRFLKQSLFSLLLGLGLSSFFWIPAIFEKNLILLSKIPIADRHLYFVHLNQLILPSWGYAPPTEANGFSYQIGIGHLIIFILFFCLGGYFYFKKRKQDQLFKNAVIIFIYTTILIAMMFSFSNSLWQLPLLKEINYPWTLLLPIGFLLSFLAGFLGYVSKKLSYLVIITALLSSLFTLQYAHPEYFTYHDDFYYLTNDATTTSSSELMPLWVKTFPQTSPANKVDIVTGEGKVSNIESNSKKISFILDLTENSLVQINTIYYPGWRVLINGKETPLSYSNPQGVMQFNLPPGNYIVLATFSETSLRLISDFISTLSLIIVILIPIMGKIKLKK